MPEQKKQPKFQFELKLINEFLRVHYDEIQRFNNPERGSG